MRWIIHYDIVAFAIIGILIIVYSIYGHLKTFTNNVYKRLLYISLFSVITDISSAYAGSYFNENQIILNYSIHLLHFIVQNLVPCFYCLFAYSLVYENEKINRKWFAIIFVPYIFNFSLIICFLQFSDRSEEPARRKRLQKYKIVLIYTNLLNYSDFSPYFSSQSGTKRLRLKMLSATSSRSHFGVDVAPHTPTLSSARNHSLLISATESI